MTSSFECSKDSLGSVKDEGFLNYLTVGFSKGLTHGTSVNTVTYKLRPKSF